MKLFIDNRENICLSLFFIPHLASASGWCTV